MEALPPASHLHVVASAAVSVDLQRLHVPGQSVLVAERQRVVQVHLVRLGPHQPPLLHALIHHHHAHPQGKVCQAEPRQNELTKLRLRIAWLPVVGHTGD